MAHILLANDDGIHAPGLYALVRAFLQANHRVTVVAPDRERSAAAQSLTIKAPIVLSPYTFTDCPCEAFTTDGTPADCVKIALRALYPGEVDLVVSGINRGWNIGTDTVYSGTVGAAREGVFEGVPAIAVSVMQLDDANYEAAAQLAVDVAKKMLANPFPDPVIVNLNLPDAHPSTIQGLVEARLCRLTYSDCYRRMDHTRGRSALWLYGDIERADAPEGTDLFWLHKGYSTLTVLGWDTTMAGMGGTLGLCPRPHQGD